MHGHCLSAKLSENVAFCSQYTEPADYVGRKVTLMMSGVLVVVGGSIQSAAVQGAVWYACMSLAIKQYSVCLFVFQDVDCRTFHCWTGIWVLRSFCIEHM